MTDAEALSAIRSIIAACGSPGCVRCWREIAAAVGEAEAHRVRPGALLEADRLLATPSAEVSRLRHVQSGLRDWAQGRVETLARCIATDGVAPGTKAEMMYERTIMRDIVAMLDEATPEAACSVTGRPHATITTCVDCDWDRRRTDSRQEPTQ